MFSRKVLASALAGVLLIIGQWAHAVPIQWEVSAGGNGHWYEFVRQEGINWFGADAAATASTHMGITGHLATMTSAAENAFAFALVDFKPNSNRKGSIWLGGVQPVGAPEPAGGWGWVTGENWDYTNWAGVEPNNGGNEQYLTFDDFTDRNGTWNDWDGFNGASGYVIEYSVARVAEPHTLILLGAGLLALVGRRKRVR